MIIKDIRFEVRSFRFEEPLKVAFATLTDWEGLGTGSGSGARRGSRSCGVSIVCRRRFPLLSHFHSRSHSIRG